MIPAKGYTEVKDSGILGCGSIPSHWGTIPLKYVSLLDGKVDTSYIKPEDEVSFAPMECVRNDKRIPRTALKSKDNGTYSSFCDGDIAIAKVTPCFENGNICIMDSLENGYAFGSSELFSIRPTNIVRRFLFYCLQTPYFIDGGVATMTGVGGLKRVSSYYMKNAKIALPPFPEQSAIAAYLDTQCAKIDEIIAQAKASIEDYKQWKASIIYEAVTKGLDPNVEMKDSGIEWIGKMPKRWQDINPKALFSQRKERANPGDRQLTASQQFGVIYQDEYMELTGAKVVTVEKDFDILKHVSAGDFVISMRSFQGGLEYSTKSGSISSAYVMLVPNLKLVYPRYYRWLLKSNGYIRALQSTSDLVRDGQAMRYSNFAKVRLINPPIGEQEQIANYLDTQCAKIDTLMTEKQSLIDDLESYKKSLIYEVVTGKRRV